MFLIPPIARTVWFWSPLALQGQFLPATHFSMSSKAKACARRSSVPVPAHQRRWLWPFGGTGCVNWSGGAWDGVSSSSCGDLAVIAAGLSAGEVLSLFMLERVLVNSLVSIVRTGVSLESHATPEHVGVCLQVTHICICHVRLRFHVRVEQSQCWMKGNFCGHRCALWRGFWVICMFCPLQYCTRSTPKTLVFWALKLFVRHTRAVLGLRSLPLGPGLPGLLTRPAQRSWSRAMLASPPVSEPSALIRDGLRLWLTLPRVGGAGRACHRQLPVIHRTRRRKVCILQTSAACAWLSQHLWVLSASGFYFVSHRCAPERNLRMLSGVC